MSGFNWQAAGISFGVCFAGGMIITYSLTLPGRKQWYFTPPTEYPVKPDRSSMFTGELARSNVSPELPTSSSYDYSARLPNTPSGAPVFSSPAPSAPAPGWPTGRHWSGWETAAPGRGRSRACQAHERR